jgi:hypothetical protein
MNDTRRDEREVDNGSLVRDALQRAAMSGPEPDMTHLLDAVPAMLAEARRRRLLERRTPLAAIVPLASRAIPRLAAATAVLALLATATLVFDLGARSGDRTDLDTVILGGAETGSGVEDLLLGKAGTAGDENG